MRSSAGAGVAWVVVVVTMSIIKIINSIRQMIMMMMRSIESVYNQRVGKLFFYVQYTKAKSWICGLKDSWDSSMLQVSNTQCSTCMLGGLI